MNRRTLLQAAGAAGLGLAAKPGRAQEQSRAPLRPLVISASERAAMRGHVKAFMEEFSVPGASLAIAVDGRLAFSEGFGLADKEKLTPVKPESLFRIASVSKPVTAVAAFRLIEAGKLKQTDRVFGPEGILREFAAESGSSVDKITVEHLLTHTCGGWQNDGSDPMFRHRAMSQKELIAWTVRNQPLQHESGEHYAYSNFGYCVLGRVIEHVAGMPYESFVQHEVLARSGIRRMRVGGSLASERAEDEVAYYGQKGEDPYKLQVARMDAHGGWIASAPDLVGFATHVDGFPTVPDILAPEAVRAMTTATVANPGYARGWSINPAGNWWHNGSMPGTTAIMVRTASGLCWAGLVNTRRPGGGLELALDQLMWKVAREVPAWRA